MNKKRFYSLALALLMAAVAFTSCNDNSTDESSAPSANSDAVVSTAGESSAEPEVSVGPLDHLVDRYTDKEVTFLVNTQTDLSSIYRSIEICPNDEDQSYTYMNESVERRNRLIEEQLGIKISEIRTTTMTNDITNAINTGSQEFQVVCPWMTDAGPLVASGCFYDLYDFDDIIRFDQPYWDNNANESLSINNKLYFTTGDFSLLSMDVTHCILFNRDIISEYGLEDPYELVAEGKWTLDKMMELATAFTSDTDGEAGYSYKDNIGLHVNTNYCNSFFIGSGESFIRKDSNDTPYLAIYNERATEVVGKITSVFSSDASLHIEGYRSQAQQDGFSSCYVAARDALANKRALFVTISLSNIISFANIYDCNFGLLVTPKYNEEQDSYHSYISVIYASCVAIPLSNEDPETAALAIEALNAASTETTKKDYYQRLLKTQKLKDEEGEQMLDFIFDNRIYDLGAIYNWGNLRNFFDSICVTGTDMFTSKYEANKGKIEDEINKTLEFAS